MSQSGLQLTHAAKDDPDLFLVLLPLPSKYRYYRYAPHTWLRFPFYRQENQGQESQIFILKAMRILCSLQAGQEPTKDVSTGRPTPGQAPSLHCSGRQEPLQVQGH